MAANNEIGVLQPLASIGALCRERGVLFHCDAAQAVGHVPLAMDELGIDLLSLSGHKLYAPRASGPCCDGREWRWHPSSSAAARRVACGATAVPLIVGLGAAMAGAMADRDTRAGRLGALRDRAVACRPSGECGATATRSGACPTT